VASGSAGLELRQKKVSSGGASLQKSNTYIFFEPHCCIPTRSGAGGGGGIQEISAAIKREAEMPQHYHNKQPQSEEGHQANR
jgi:hypothetical protein